MMDLFATDIRVTVVLKDKKLKCFIHIDIFYSNIFLGFLNIIGKKILLEKEEIVCFLKRER